MLWLGEMMREIVDRQEYLEYMTFRCNQRPLFTEIFGLMVGLREEWVEQGATADELDLSSFRYRAPAKVGVPVNTGWLGGEPGVVLEDTPDYKITLDSRGRRMKLCKGFATIPLPLDYPVRTMDDWLALKPHYEFSESRFGYGWEQAARDHAAAGRVVTVSIPGGFDEPRQLMGEERVCLAFHDQPELIHDMLATIGETAFRVLERVSQAVQVDELMVHEDLAGKSGPLVGPSQVAEFISPYYRRVWDMLSPRGARLFTQDSDGNIGPVIPAFLDTGVNVMFPMEPAAGMDIAKLRQTYGTRLAFVGGIDKHVLRSSKADIDAELAYKIPSMLQTGGCVLGLDHRIPNGTPLEMYRYYVRRVWEMIG